MWGSSPILTPSDLGPVLWAAEGRMGYAPHPGTQDSVVWPTDGHPAMGAIRVDLPRCSRSAIGVVNTPGLHGLTSPKPCLSTR